MLPAEPVDAVVSGDGQQPGGKRPLTVVAGEVLVCLEEGLLSRVFSGLCLTQHPVTEVVHRFLVSLDQIRKTFVIAVLGLDDPGHFVSHRVLVGRSTSVYAGRRRQLRLSFLTIL